MGTGHEIREYTYVNRRLLGRLASQLGIPLTVERSSEVEIGSNLSIFSAKLKKSRKVPAPGPDDPAVISAVVDGLRDSGHLHVYRPEKDVVYRTPFFVFEERILATPVYLELDKGPFASAPTPLTVWVSDPTVDQDESVFVTQGTFLFLAQEVADLSGPSSIVSGFSALRMVTDFVAGCDSPSEGKVLERLHDRSVDDVSRSWLNRRLGRPGKDYPTPVEKLRRAGGVVGRPRELESVYKVAYMTDEQWWPQGRRLRRVNDLCAYPLYISQ